MNESVENREDEFHHELENNEVDNHEVELDNSEEIDIMNNDGLQLPERYSISSFIFDSDENESEIDNLDIIDMGKIDDNMCKSIWNDFKEQYKPFINSLFKLTNIDARYYFSFAQNREIVYNYINKRLKGVKLLKFRPIGNTYIFFTLKRVNDTKNKLRIFEKRLMEFNDRLDIIQEQMNKIYNAPGMPGYMEALNNFNDLMNNVNSN